MSVASTATPWRIGFDRSAQIKAVVVTVAFVALFWSTLRSLSDRWINDPDWSHGLIIPLFSVYLAYQKWDQIKRSPLIAAWLGLPILLLSVALYVFNHTPWGMLMGGLQAYFMLGALLGVIILLCGLPVMRYAWLPWAYLLFAIPLPRGIYFALTDPLRRFAATAASGLLMLIPNLNIERAGSMLEYEYQGQFGQIGVADACSGMRSTITLCALGVAIAYVTDRSWWQRLILIAACVPIAVFCNLIRVLVTCVLHIFVDPKYAEGTAHTMLGLAVLLLAFGLFSGLGWILNNLVVESSDGTDADGAAPGVPARV